MRGREGSARKESGLIGESRKVGRDSDVGTYKGGGGGIGAGI